MVVADRGEAVTAKKVTPSGTDRLTPLTFLTFLDEGEEGQEGQKVTDQVRDGDLLTPGGLEPYQPPSPADPTTTTASTLTPWIPACRRCGSRAAGSPRARVRAIVPDRARGGGPAGPSTGSGPTRDRGGRGGYRRVGDRDFLVALFEAGRTERYLDAERVALLDADTAAELLSVPASWLLAQARRDAVPHVRLGRYVRFEPEQLQAWGRQDRGPVAETVRTTLTVARRRANAPGRDRSPYRRDRWPATLDHEAPARSKSRADATGRRTWYGRYYEGGQRRRRRLGTVRDRQTRPA